AGGVDNYVTWAPHPGGPTFSSGTNASDTPITDPICGPGNAQYTYGAVHSNELALDTLDTTRGEGFVEFRMMAPFPDVTTTYPQSASMTGVPDSSGSVTVLVGGIPSEGDWGFPLGAAGQVPPGHLIDPVIPLFCDPLPSRLPTPDTTPCKYGPGMRIHIRALNGSRFLDNPVTPGPDTTGAQWDLNLKSTGTRVGTCYVTAAKDEVLCRVVVAGTANAGDALVTAVPVEMLTTTATSKPAVQVYWKNPYGEEQRGTNGKNDLWGHNDFLTLVTHPSAR
ncbi:hypothetical protein, partial [Streptomyces lavendulocolor]|uniref:hypothetical protein n=1 Tax=Streptomyces lavendulocolor TaxID=67316 RepID=UPI0033E00260